MTRYHEAQSVSDALAVLASDPEVKVVAGGTDIIVGTRQDKREMPKSLLAVHRITELQQLESIETGGLRIGALVTHAMLESDPQLRNDYSALPDSAALIGSPATRNVGTLGGNLVNASPAMDTGAPLMVLDARVTLRSSSTERVLPVAELFIGPGETVMRHEELLIAVEIPSLPDRTGSAYVRLEYRQAMEIAVAGAAAYVELDKQQRVVNSRIVLSAVAPTLVRAPAAEAALKGLPATAEVFARAGDLARESASPIGDVRAPEHYRDTVLPVIVKRALDAASQRAQGESIPIPASRLGRLQD